VGARVTVAIPTARRPELLARLLAALPAAVEGVDVEVLVVDNAGPHEGNRAAATALGRYLVEPTPGSSHARNLAIAETTTPLLAFLDDDVVPSPGWLGRLLAGRGTAVAAGGPVALDPAVRRPRWFDEEGIGGYVSRFGLDASRSLRPDEHLLTANCVFDLEALRSVGGFDPRLGPRPGVQLVADDVHGVRQLMRRGGEVRFVADAGVTHDLPPERLRRRWLLRRAYLQGRSDWLLDEDVLRHRALGGARVAASWLVTELGRRRAEGLGRREVRFHLAADLARTGGALRQGLGLRRGP
jgi:glycosyltransferase involved in cell wall biosynthesis